MKIILPVRFSIIYDARHEHYFFAGTFNFQKDSLSLSSSDNICKWFRSRSGLHNTKNLFYIQTCLRKNSLMVFSLKNAACGIMNNIRSKNLIDFQACKEFTFEAPAKYNNKLIEEMHQRGHRPSRPLHDLVILYANVGRQTM